MRPLSQQRASPLQIDIQTQSLLWDAQPLAAQIVRDAIGAAASALSTAGGEVSIVLTNDSAIRDLNREWRGIDKPTNVLSFPASSQTAGGDAALLGDIVIAYETLESECDDENRIFLHHLAHLAVHAGADLFRAQDPQGSVGKAPFRPTLRPAARFEEPGHHSLRRR